VPREEAEKPTAAGDEIAAVETFPDEVERLRMPGGECWTGPGEGGAAGDEVEIFGPLLGEASCEGSKLTSVLIARPKFIGLGRADPSFGLGLVGEPIMGGGLCEGVMTTLCSSGPTLLFLCGIISTEFERSRLSFNNEAALKPTAFGGVPMSEADR